MASGSTSYPGAPDVFTVPSDPEDTSLSSAGDGTRDLTQSVGDQGAAIMALEAHAAVKTHTHAGGADGTLVLPQSSTHGVADTDTSATAIHHTLGLGAFQASPGNRVYAYSEIQNTPFVVCTSVNRPPSPFLGQTIIETDTGVWRQWFQYSTSEPVWQILPIGNKPHFRVEAQTTQDVLREENHACLFTTILDDFIYGIFGIANFMVVDTSNTDVIIPEPGYYHVHASICWDPAHTFQDQSSVQITVNNADIGRKNWEYIRGNAFTPGFSQTNEIDFYWHFQAGDVLRMIAAHNAQETSILWYNPNPPTRQVCYLEVTFHGV